MTKNLMEGLKRKSPPGVDKSVSLPKSPSVNSEATRDSVARTRRHWGRETRSGGGHGRERLGRQQQLHRGTEEKEDADSQAENQVRQEGRDEGGDGALQAWPAPQRQRQGAEGQEPKTGGRDRVEGIGSGQEGLPQAGRERRVVKRCLCCGLPSRVAFCGDCLRHIVVEHEAEPW